MENNKIKEFANRIWTKCATALNNERGDGAPGTIMGIAFAIIAIGVLVMAFRAAFPQMWQQIVDQFMGLF